MAKYIKKPIIVEAFKWTGGIDQTEDPEWIIEAIKAGKVYFGRMAMFKGKQYVQLQISTLEGLMTANVGDYIIQGIKGEIYPCKPDIFEETYEPVNEGKNQNKN